MAFAALFTALVFSASIFSARFLPPANRRSALPGIARVEPVQIILQLLVSGR